MFIDRHKIPSCPLDSTLLAMRLSAQGIKSTARGAAPRDNAKALNAEQEIATLTEEEQFFTRAVGFRTTANDLQTLMNSLAPGGVVPDKAKDKLVAYMLSTTVLRALSAEIMLKAIALARSTSFRREHDLALLYNALDDNIKKHIGSVADSYGVADPERILERHRSEFVDWRYPAVGGLGSNLLDLDKVLQVLHDVYRQIKAGNAP